MTPRDVVRDTLASSLDWQDAHASFEAAIGGIPPEKRGIQPPGLPYSLWQLLEHMRLAQHDILDFCINANYHHDLKWPDDYWPRDPAPPTDTAWDECIAAFRHDRNEVATLARDPARDLSASIPHGTGQTYLREVVLTADHNAYHIGQLVLVRRLLGIWPAA